MDEEPNNSFPCMQLTSRGGRIWYQSTIIRLPASLLHCLQFFQPDMLFSSFCALHKLPSPRWLFTLFHLDNASSSFRMQIKFEVQCHCASRVPHVDLNHGICLTGLQLPSYISSTPSSSFLPLWVPQGEQMCLIHLYIPPPHPLVQDLEKTKTEAKTPKYISYPHFTSLQSQQTNLSHHQSY